MRSISKVVTLGVLAASPLLAAGCSDDDTEALPKAGPEADGADRAGEADAPATAATGLRVVTPDDAAATLADPPDGLVLLDVRTPEEFDAGHLDGAIMIDFYEGDFADRIAELDRDVPYVIYCRSGNRSGQTRELMEELGFASVDDVGGGIVAWAEAGLPITVDG